MRLKKLFATSALAAFLVAGSGVGAIAQPQKPAVEARRAEAVKEFHRAMARHKRWRRWCQNNWDECKKRWLERLREKEACIEKAKSFKEARQCLRELRMKKRQKRAKETVK